MEFTTQLRVLLGKNCLLKTKSKCGICCEIVFPIIVTALLIALIALISMNNGDYKVNEMIPFEAFLKETSKILYGPTPLTAQQQSVLDNVQSLISNNSGIPLPVIQSLLVGFGTIESMDAYYAANSSNARFGVWFNNNQSTSTTNSFAYSIRMDANVLPSNADVEEEFAKSDSFFERGFTSLQQTIDQSILNVIGGFNRTLSSQIQLFPDPYDTSAEKFRLGRDVIFKNAGGVFITAALFMYAFRLITDLVVEKETKIREGMKMMGMSDGAYFLSWNITSMLIGLPVTLLVFIIIRGLSIIKITNWGTVCGLFVFYFISLLLLGNIASLFFDKSKFAGIISYIIVLGLSVVGIFVSKANMSKSAKLILSLISPIGFQNAIYSMGVRDIKDSTPDPRYFAPENHIVGMLFLDILLYAFFVWYLDKVLPGEFGTTQKFYFLFTPSYWFGNRNARRKRYSEMDVGDGSSSNYSDDIELIPTDIRNKTAVSIRNLCKEFQTGNGKRVAVVHLNLEFYQDQIHSLLGHNGSGKSTTIGCLTGLIPPTAGDATIQGFNISNQMHHIRRVIGVCLQQDILWETLTVHEHLKIYAALKGIIGNEIDKAATEMANEVGLGEKMHAQSKTLSGGQKRKLCLGIAFIGRSQVIFLDEVTSGMDPLSRRGVWDFLLKYRKNRTIILTTHYFDEADYLSDRIAIISHGRLRCDGSPLFLKKKFGVGYLLTLAKIPNACQSQAVTKFIQSFIPEATILSDVGTELSYRLPTASVDRFVTFFQDLDSQKGYLGISSYGVSITTMEEVFLRIGQESSSNGRQFDINSNDNGNGGDENRHNAAITTSSQGRVWSQQLKALLIKRVRTSYKDLRGFILSILLPALIIFASIIVYKKVKGNDETFAMYPLLLSIGQYGASNRIPITTVDGQLGGLASSPFKSMIHLVENQTMKDYLYKNFDDEGGAFQFQSSLVNQTDPQLNYITMYNLGYPQSVPIHLNFISDALLRNLTSGSAAGIQTYYQPFKHVPSLLEKQFENAPLETILYFVFLFLAGYSLMAASFAGSVCQERAFQIKRLLYISGCKKYVYWLSNLIWDYFFAAVLIAIVTIILTSVEHRFKEQAGIVLISQILYCAAVIPLSYLFSYRFRSHGRATGAIFGIFYIMSLVFLIVSINLRLRAQSGPNYDLEKAANICDYVFFVLSPLYCLARIMVLVSQFPGMTPIGVFQIKNYWSVQDGCGKPLLFLVAHLVVWLTWIFVLDMMPVIKGKLRNPKNSTAPTPFADEDSDVSHERARLSNMSHGYQQQKDVIMIQGLYKLFKGSGKNPNKVAVHNTTLGIPRGEIFGLLGLNGAGKSTTLSMLSGDILPSSGEISINGYDIIANRADALENIGSCPQFDSLVSLLSCREQLWLYSRIKGIPEHQIHDTVEAFISLMDLNGIADSNVGGYSGGNKRKVSLSIAMLGNPSVVFLDEVSTGCDPQVRRFMWNVIAQLGKNKVIILTTHSMPECEALCQRVSIMKDGRLMCLGSNQHIKSKFGSGYSIDIKFKKEYLENGVELVMKAIPGTTLLDRHDLIANFELPNPPSNPVLVSQIFQILQQQLYYLMDDYSVSQTSLEQIFLKLTNSTYQARMEANSERSLEQSLHLFDN